MARAAVSEAPSQGVDARWVTVALSEDVNVGGSRPADDPSNRRTAGRRRGALTGPHHDSQKHPSMTDRRRRGGASMINESR